MRAIAEAPLPAARSAPLSAEEPALVRAARRGDREAFAWLHTEYAPMVHGILLARTPRAAAPSWPWPPACRSPAA